MKRVLTVAAATAAAATIGISSVASAAPAPSAPRTNTAAVSATKFFTHRLYTNQTVKAYKSLAPNQHKLISQKKFTACFKPFSAGVKDEGYVRTQSVKSSTRKTVPGYKGKAVYVKRVTGTFKVTPKKGKPRTTTAYLDVAYVNGAFHPYLPADVIGQCNH